MEEGVEREEGLEGAGDLIARLSSWVEEYPEEADVPHINLTTQTQFTVRGILDQLVEERHTGHAVLDAETLKIRDEIDKWLGR